MSLTRSLLPLTLVAVWSLNYTEFTAARPLTSQGDEEDTLFDPNLFEGDILITPEQYEEYYGDGNDGNDKSAEQPEQHVSSLWLASSPGSLS